MQRLSPETFLAVGHQMIRNLGGPMAILLPRSLLSALVTLALLWPHRDAAAFWWMAAGFGLMVAALVITLAVEVPIDNQIQAWTVATLPGDWRSIQTRWELFHTIRTFLSIAAVAAVTISTVVAARPDDRPVDQVVPPGRAVAGTGRHDDSWGPARRDRETVMDRRDGSRLVAVGARLGRSQE
jgi:Domain of unknown function (DUF1772)